MPRARPARRARAPERGSRGPCRGRASSRPAKVSGDLARRRRLGGRRTGRRPRGARPGRVCGSDVMLRLSVDDDRTKQVLGRVVYAPSAAAARAASQTGRRRGPHLLARRRGVPRRGARRGSRTTSSGEFAGLRGLGGPGPRARGVRRAASRGTGTSPRPAGPASAGPRSTAAARLPLLQQVVFHEEYARADAPARVSHIGEELLGPTLIAFGTEAQKQRFLPGSAPSTELWCQGYSEPGAGSDLAGVSTQAPRVDGDQWVVDGQKVWTSLAHVADWCFVVARTEPGSQRHQGLSYLLVPMDQEGVEVRPIEQLTGGSEFNEVFFDGARTDADLVVGEPGDGWKVAMATARLRARRRHDRPAGRLRPRARGRRRAGPDATAPIDDPVVARPAGPGPDGARGDAAQRAAHARRLRQASRRRGPRPRRRSPSWCGRPGTARSASSPWRCAGAAALTVARGAVRPRRLAAAVPVHAGPTRIYGGSNEIQRNIIAERVLGLPREARV